MSDYTEHYQLHQWEPEDPFLRTDFNQDLSKIDTALDSLAEDMSRKAEQSELDEVRALATQSRFTKLKEINITEYLTSFEIDLSDVDWTKWDKVHLDCMAYDMPQSRLYINSSEGFFLFQTNTDFSQREAYSPRITMFPGFRADRFVSLQSYNGTMIYPTGILFSEFKNIVFKGGFPWPGNQFVLWGET